MQKFDMALTRSCCGSTRSSSRHADQWDRGSDRIYPNVNTDKGQKKDQPKDGTADDAVFDVNQRCPARARRRRGGGRDGGSTRTFKRHG
jgi:hypothetical protein